LPSPSTSPRATTRGVGSAVAVVETVAAAPLAVFQPRNTICPAAMVTHSPSWSPSTSPTPTAPVVLPKVAAASAATSTVSVQALPMRPKRR